MPYRYWVALPLLISFILSGCSRSSTYKPSLALAKSPVTIKARAQVEPFVDNAPTEDGSREPSVPASGIQIRFGGTTSTTEPWNTRFLARDVTDAVINDFSASGVFQEVGGNIENPDVIVKGEINRFHGKAKTNTLGWITTPAAIVAPVWLLGIPVQSSEGSVNITLRVNRRDGTPIGVYSGEGKFSESHSVYSGQPSDMGNRLNKAFSQAIEQIRVQIIADAQKF